MDMSWFREDLVPIPVMHNFIFDARWFFVRPLIGTRHGSCSGKEWESLLNDTVRSTYYYARNIGAEVHRLSPLGIPLRTK